MKLLLDENLSPALASRLADIYVVVHVRDLGLAAASDTQLWTLAREQGFTIVSKDSDFHQRSSLLGAPPKVIWLALGNCSTDDVEACLRNYLERVEAFHADVELSFLKLGRWKGLR